ncbi:MAG: ABC transporter ATP-binding protein [Cohaesibacteraceae bacterium]|nr:ABC transporter ATP-binding protein [Cohaesibacteraceae bacterium]
MFRWFEKYIDPFSDDSLDQPPSTMGGFCWHFTRPVLPIIIAMSILGGTIALLEVAILSFFGNIVDWLANADRATFLEDNYWQLMLMGGTILIVIPLVEIIWQVVFHQGLMANYPMSIRWRVHRYLLRQSMSFYQDDFAGRVANKMMQTALAVREVVTRIMDVLVFVCIYFTAGFILVTQANIAFALPLGGWLAAYLVVLFYFIPKLKNNSRKQADARSVMTGHVVDAYTNISTVKLFSHAAREELYAKRSMTGFLKTVYRQMRLVSWMNISLNIINNLLLFSVGLMSIRLWLVSQITVGEITLATGLVLRLQGMSQWILWEVSGLFESIGTVQDGINTISKPRVVMDKPDAGELDVKKGELVFENVKFHYGKSSGVIENLSMKINSGEKIGLIGRSGAGKSTIVNLLLRFYDLEKGCIRIDGVSINDVTQESLRSQIGVVTQDTSLLHRSVFDNIVYGKQSASIEEALEAASKAHATEFLNDLVDLDGRRGMDAHVGERGVKLSGGQRQRIAIARVLLKNAPILLLDEATSALDSEVEAAIQDSLLTLMDGKTVIAIAHRLSTIAHMDRLIVLDKGEIVEEGTHAALIQSGGIYAQLWERQSGGFLAAAEH